MPSNRRRRIVLATTAACGIAGVAASLIIYPPYLSQPHPFPFWVRVACMILMLPIALAASALLGGATCSGLLRLLAQLNERDGFRLVAGRKAKAILGGAAFALLYTFVVGAAWKDFLPFALTMIALSTWLAVAGFRQPEEELEAEPKVPFPPA